LAVCPNSNDVRVYSNVGSKSTDDWELSHTLEGVNLAGDLTGLPSFRDCPPPSQHDLLVTSIDWCPVTGRIVTCSQDRNAFVWTFNSSTGEWTKQMVLLRINRAATSCRWSPNGKKFAVSSGSNTVCICSFDEVSDWWVSQAITRFKSTVNAVEWHPNSMLVAAPFACPGPRHALRAGRASPGGGSGGGSAALPLARRASSPPSAIAPRRPAAQAWVTDIGDTPDVGPFGSAEGLEFGDMIVDRSISSDTTTAVRGRQGTAWLRAHGRLDTQAAAEALEAPLPPLRCTCCAPRYWPVRRAKRRASCPPAWINAAAWSPSGNCLAYATQASDVCFLSARGGAVTEQTIRVRGLPALSLAFIDDKTLVAAGFDMNPAIFRHPGDGWVTSGEWSFDTFADKKPETGKAGTGGGSAFSAARSMFASKVATGRAAAASSEKLWTRHEAAIVEVRALTKPAGKAAGAAAAAAGSAVTGSFSTAGSDGRIVVWTM
ncbi:arcA, partial [Symbiodinium sp. KB8]